MHSEYIIVTERDSEQRPIAYSVYHVESDTLVMRTTSQSTAENWIKRLTVKPGAKR